MKLRAFAIAVVLVASVALPPPVHARSLMGFLRAVGNSIAHPKHHPKRPPSSRPVKRAPSTATKSEARQNTAAVQPTDAPTTESPPNERAQGAPSPLATVVPEPIVRSAATPPAGSGMRRDVPYAVPVPNKAGFVTSPYAPRAGLVDVRGFPSGTEVKDPYTGKVFLTP